MIGAVIAFALPRALLAWARGSGRRAAPALALVVFTIAQVGHLIWLALGSVAAVLLLATRRLWLAHWLRLTPFLRKWRIRRWAAAGWAPTVNAVGLGPFRDAPPAPLRILSVADGIQAHWALPFGVTVSDVETERAALAAFFDAPRLDIARVRPTVVGLTWRWDEPLAESRRLDEPTPGTVCLADGFLIGRDESGENVRWSPLSPSSHALVAGGTRSGKSVALQTLLTQAASMPDLQVCGVDPTGILLAPFESAPDSENLACGTSPEALLRAVDVLAHLVDVVLVERLQHLRETKQDAIREPTSEHPLLLFVLEEYPARLAACSADDTAATRKPQDRLRVRVELYVQRLLAEGLKAAIVVVLAAQRADADVLGGYRRDQMSTRIAFRLESADGWRMVFPATPDLAGAAADLAPGEGYILTPGAPITRFRSDYLDCPA